MQEPKKVDRITKLRRQVFQIFIDPLLRQNLQLKFLWDQSFKVVQVTLMHRLKVTNEQRSEVIYVKFPESYPEQPPTLTFKTEDLPDIFLKSQFLYNWKPQTRLRDYLQDIYSMVNSYLQNEAEFKANQNKKIYNGKQKEVEKLSEDEESESEEKSKIKLLINSTSQSEISETKNLNRHFKSKLKQILRELNRNYPPTQDSKTIQEIFSDNQVGFQEIRKALNNEWFNGQIKWQIKNGRFLNRIMRGMMGIRSKKLMIKYYHVMIAAVQNPQSFVCWKYDE